MQGKLCQQLVKLVTCTYFCFSAYKNCNLREIVIGVPTKEIIFLKYS